MSLLFVHNQHVKNNYKFYNGLCKEVFKNEKINSSILYLTNNDVLKFHPFKDTFTRGFSYEDYYLNLKSKDSKTDLVDEFIKKILNNKLVSNYILREKFFRLFYVIKFNRK